MGGRDKGGSGSAAEEGGEENGGEGGGLARIGRCAALRANTPPLPTAGPDPKPVQPTAGPDLGPGRCPSIGARSARPARVRAQAKISLSSIISAAQIQHCPNPSPSGDSDSVQ